MDDKLTPRQEQFFEILEKIDPSPDMRRIIDETKQDIVVRGLTRVKGFTPNEN